MNDLNNPAASIQSRLTPPQNTPLAVHVLSKPAGADPASREPVRSFEQEVTEITERNFVEEILFSLFAPVKWNELDRKDFE